MTAKHLFVLFFVTSLCVCHSFAEEQKSENMACIDMVKAGFRPIDDNRQTRFLGKVASDTALCRGGEKATAFRYTPWVDWSNYWASGDSASLKEGEEAITILGEHLKPNGRGIDGSLMDLEYQRVELIKFNLFDNYTYEEFIKGRSGKDGSTIKQWDAMRLDATSPYYDQVGGAGIQLCGGELIRYRTLTGICNDLINPKMGSTGTDFARNVDFESTFPRLGKTEVARNRHSDAEHGMRIDLLTPDPQLISRKLFTRRQSADNGCNDGMGASDPSSSAECDYLKAPFFNVLAAFWIQFMTHDWFSHLQEGRNARGYTDVGCKSEEAQALGCRPEDQIEPSLFDQTSEPGRFQHNNKQYLNRAFKTTQNTVTAWWDASQIYGYDDISLQRVLRDPEDNAKLAMPSGYLPLLASCSESTLGDCPVQPQWQGQEAAAFPDNWNIGLSFYHNLFVREHNYFVDQFRALQGSSPDADSGLRNPSAPEKVITYQQVTDEELYQAARLVVSAMIAKIHTIEWTTQLLYNDPMYRAMNSNWFGLFNLEEGSRVSAAIRKITQNDENFFSRASDWLAGLFGGSDKAETANSWYSVFASGAGIFGLQNTRPEGMLWWEKDAWDITNPEHVNGGVNHFGSPFNFPEEFTSVYRLHPLVPDLIEMRDYHSANEIGDKVAVLDTVRAGATAQMRRYGLENWALAMGRQRLGVLHLQNHPRFLQNLPMPHLDTPSQKIDVVALDIIRDRERGVPRFNEFRRQIGLKTLTSFDDFVDRRLDPGSPARMAQEQVVNDIRSIYGTHTCDASKVISDVQLNDDGSPINDCHGAPDGSVVDNIEDVDLAVGWLAEYTRPHGFAISETQFHIFIINASRRLFSDRFFTSSYRPEFYSSLGYDWVMNNGPLSECPYELETSNDGIQQCNEPRQSNGHTIAVSPLKRLLMRNVPELREELMPVVNVFDPWARDRGEYYSLEWTPRKGAELDPAFRP
ncbi:peroxidase family protein [Alteromonas aestuariivivens]|nr:peroxidase family protein [Alteromonas aestuariivivens]